VTWDSGLTRGLGGGRGRSGFRLHQPVNVHDEIAHLGVVDARLCFRAPRRMRCFVVREDADNVELFEILELDALRRNELASENQMQQLSRRVVDHGLIPVQNSIAKVAKTKGFTQSLRAQERSSVSHKALRIES